MKRFSWVPIILVVMVVLMACSFTSALSERDKGNDSAPKEGLPGVQEKTGKNLQEDAKSSDAEPVESLSSFHDDFTGQSTDWGDTLTVTTQAIGGKEGSQVKMEAGKLTFQFQAKETYAYKFLEPSFPADVAIETKFLALSHINNGVALVCRANEDLTEWIEFRLSSRSRYSIYHYDQSIKENEGKNPYVQLAYGGVDIKTLYPMKENVARVTCNGPMLSLEVNGVEVAAIDGAPLQSEGRVGVGAMSTDVLPIGVQFDYLDVSVP